MGDLIEVTSNTVDKLPADLPRMVRLALAYGSKLQRGTLDVRLPDGRSVRLGGNATAWTCRNTVRIFGSTASFSRPWLYPGDR